MKATPSIGSGLLGVWRQHVWRQPLARSAVAVYALRRFPMTPSAVLALALRILSDSGTPVGNPMQIVAPTDFPVIQSRIAPLRAFRRRIDGVLDPVIYVVRTTQTFERAAAGHAPSAVLVAGSIFHERLHGTRRRRRRGQRAHQGGCVSSTLHRPDVTSPEHGGPPVPGAAHRSTPSAGQTDSFPPSRTPAAHPQRTWFSKFGALPTLAVVGHEGPRCAGGTTTRAGPSRVSAWRR